MCDGWLAALHERLQKQPLEFLPSAGRKLPELHARSGSGPLRVIYFTPSRIWCQTILKSPARSLEFLGLTDPGRVRSFNEDALHIDEAHGFVVLADGMGGHRAGDVASAAAIAAVVERLQRRIEQFRAGSRRPTPLQSLEQVAAEANRAVLRLAASQPESFKGMGTTLALALFYEDRLAYAHVGDSRIYRLRQGKMTLLTRDDSLLRDQVELGLIDAEGAADSHNRHLVTQALGIGKQIEVHLGEEATEPGDLYLLCSDGLSDMVDDADIELILNTLQVRLDLAAGHLVQFANDCGGYDNISVILARVSAAEDVESPGEQGWLSRLFSRFSRQ